MLNQSRFLSPEQLDANYFHMNVCVWWCIIMCVLCNSVYMTASMFYIYIYIYIYIMMNLCIYYARIYNMFSSKAYLNSCSLVDMSARPRHLVLVVQPATAICTVQLLRSTSDKSDTLQKNCWINSNQRHPEFGPDAFNLVRPLERLRVVLGFTTSVSLEDQCL